MLLKTERVPLARPALIALPAVATLSVGIVTHHPDMALLARVLARLGDALVHARKHGSVSSWTLVIVDNSSDAKVADDIRMLLDRQWDPAHGRALLEAADRNLGYGRAHNQALLDAAHDYHLVLNPDVLVERDALHEALRFMQEHRDVGLLTPYGEDPDGRRVSLCKRYPRVFDLFLRGFVPSFARRPFERRLARYEMADRAAGAVHTDVPMASGCFMFLRRGVLDRIEGFSGEYFMYFEDFDLSMRVAPHAEIAYVPQVRIVHYGGRASRKGWRHTAMFVRAGLTFFTKFGWRW